MTIGYPPAQSQRPNDDERTVYLGSKSVGPVVPEPVRPSDRPGQRWNPEAQQAQQPYPHAPHAGPTANPQYAPQQPATGYGQYGWENQTPRAQTGGGSKVTNIVIAVVVAIISVATLGFALTRSSKHDGQTDTTSQSATQPSEKTEQKPAGKPAESTAPAAPTVGPSTVNSLLMTIPEAAETIGTGPMVGREGFGDQIYTISKSKIVDQDCISVLPAQLDAYQGSGYSAMGQQFLSSTTQDIKMTQSVATFTDAAAAFRYVMATRTKWEKCAGRNINFRDADDTTQPNVYFTLGSVSQNDGVLNLARAQEGYGQWICQNALTSRNNVVIDLLVCGEGMQASTANAAAAKIAQKVTAAAR